MSKSKKKTGARPLGAPSKYKREYCQAILDAAKEGLFIVEFAARIGVAKSTLWEWAQAHPDFSNAMKEAKTIQEAFLVNIGRRGVTGQIDRFSASAWIFTMKACHGWRDDPEPEEEDVDIEFVGGD